MNQAGDVDEPRRSLDPAAGLGWFAPVPSWLEPDMQRVEALLMRRSGASDHALVAEASTHLVRAGGKRLRPALVLLASRAGNAGLGATDLAAAAVELVHLASLYHDDVIDGTATRRGVPTVHSKWGIEVAVLAGDYLFACGCALGAEAGGEVPAILSQAISEVCEGQILETASLGDPTRGVDAYLETIRRKTAALFRAACELGASTANAAHQRARLSTYGLHLGLAFQMVDDLLDLLGDPDVMGKQAGTDLKEGVFTLPVLLGCQKEPRLAGRLRKGERDLETVLPILQATGAVDDAVELATAHGRRALAALDGVGDPRWRAALTDVVDAVLLQVPQATAA
jgi:geranylgeranyl pyrophosphate synthase